MSQVVRSFARATPCFHVVSREVVTKCGMHMPLGKSDGKPQIHVHHLLFLWELAHVCLAR